MLKKKKKQLNSVAMELKFIFSYFKRHNQSKKCLERIVIFNQKKKKKAEWHF